MWRKAFLPGAMLLLALAFASAGTGNASPTDANTGAGSQPSADGNTLNDFNAGNPVPDSNNQAGNNSVPGESAAIADESNEGNDAGAADENNLIADKNNLIGGSNNNLIQQEDFNGSAATNPAAGDKNILVKILEDLNNFIADINADVNAAIRGVQEIVERTAEKAREILGGEEEENGFIVKQETFLVDGKIAKCFGIKCRELAGLPPEEKPQKPEEGQSEGQIEIDANNSTDANTGADANALNSGQNLLIDANSLGQNPAIDANEGAVISGQSNFDINASIGDANSFSASDTNAAHPLDRNSLDLNALRSDGNSLDSADGSNSLQTGNDSAQGHDLNSGG